MAINIYLTSHCEFVSRVEMLDWLNNLLDTNYRRIEDLCTGAAFCQIMYTLYPESINLKKIKFNARWEYEYLYNFQLLRNAFTRMKVHRDLPVLKLTKGRFQDNFELLQWFQRFYNANCGRQILPKKSSLPTRKTEKAHALSKPLSSGSVIAGGLQLKKNRASEPHIAKVTRKGSEEKITVVKQVEELEQQLEELKNEKAFYYNKLRQIEKLCSAENEDAFVRIKEINQILYAVQDGFAAPGITKEEEDLTAKELHNKLED